MSSEELPHTALPRRTPERVQAAKDKVLKEIREEGIEGPTFKNSRGQTIRSIYIAPKEEDKEASAAPTPKAIVFYLHAYDAHPHGSAERNLFKRLVAKGFVVASMDFTGHGLSDGDRDLVDYVQFLKDFSQFLSVLKEDEAKKKLIETLPFFYCGWSMGGALSILHALQRFKDADPVMKNFVGACLFAPAIANDIEPPAIFTWMLRHMFLPLCPRTRAPFIPGVNWWEFSKRKERCIELRDDYLIEAAAFRLQTGDSLLSLISEVSSRFEEISFPFQLIHGEDDDVVPYAATKDLMTKSKTPESKKRLITVKAGGHDIQGDIEVVPEDYEEMLNWFDKSLGEKLSEK